ncbi:MAG: CAP domain-containing protein [Solirubrobacteraceae bacterium]
MRVGTLSDAFLLLFDDPGHPGDACPGPRERVPRNRLVVALAVALFAVMASPAGATVRRLTKRDITARNITSSCPGADLRPTEQDLGRIRAATLCLVNRERAGRGERPLAPNERLGQAAQAHTESMAFGDYFEHDGPRGETPLSRMRAIGYISSSQIGYEVGENIGWGTRWEATPRAIVGAWMASPGHRANILDARFRDTAVGVSPHPPSSLARGQAGAIYTQDFGG